MANFLCSLTHSLVFVTWWIVVTQAFNETFEGKGGYFWITAARPHHFILSSGRDSPEFGIFPPIDYTLKHERGNYIVAAHEPESNDSLKVLFSQCMQPVGPRCKFKFSVWMSPSAYRNESLEVSTMFFCDQCDQDSMATTPKTLAIINNDDDFNGWRQYSVELTNTYSLFGLAIVASVPDTDSVVALDNLALHDCGLDPKTEKCGEDEFRCPYSKCIPASKMCDLVHDCPCGTDETNSYCEVIPNEGRVTFSGCNFTSGHCYWYNSPLEQYNRTGAWKVITPETYNITRHIILPNPWQTPGGSYVFVRLRTEGPSLTLRSVPFPSCNSEDGRCKVRFWYWRRGDMNLHLELVELHGKTTGAVHTLWSSPARVLGQPKWRQVEVTINNIPRHSYVLQFTVNSTAKPSVRALALTNITLTPACFTQERPVNLTTCGATGPEGPTQAMCNHVYQSQQNVKVIGDGPLAGAQLWSVQVSAMYRLQAYGARGGNGERELNLKTAFGALVHAKFRLNQGEQLLVVVGQSGESYCQGTLGTDLSSYCSTDSADNSTVYPRSGGGGGGATFVYRRRPWKDDFELIVMAGGGGGLPYVTYKNTHFKAIQLDEWRNPWLWANNTDGFAGRACHLPNTTDFPRGGFGAGYGTCDFNGGHGGGYLGPLYVPSVEQIPGQPGDVHVHPDNLYYTSDFYRHPGEGRLEIHRVDWTCPCHYMCLVQRPDLLGQEGVKAIQDGVIVCICPPGHTLESDGLSCTTNDTSEAALPVVQADRSEDMPLGVAILVSIVLVIIIVILVVASFVVYAVRIKPGDERMWAVRMLMSRCFRVRMHNVPLHTFPPTGLPARVMQINPNYSFPAGKMPEQKLPEIPRDNLRMSVQLGQGAFGEVYKGFLSGVSGTEREVAVAVKTLPPMCSEQTELDFYMEAYIISKFHHPNIVQFLGVCFDHHPRYLVLELLEGGNLKAFLRENRPAQGKMSELSVGDLVNLARDVACGCHYLEKNHFIHRDIAARNCLLTTKEPERVAKIADFGMSRDVYRADYYKKEGRALLPLKWMPPEAFMEGIFTSKTDVWSYGVVLWEIFSMGYMPYPGLNNTEVMNFVYIGGRLDPPDGCPPKVIELMQCCWKHKAEERPSFGMLLQALDSISQDTATMNQHLPPFRWPCGSEGRGLKLLNPPVPAIGLDSCDSSSSPDTGTDTSNSCPDMEPLLKPGLPNGVRSRHETDYNSRPRNETDYKLTVAMNGPNGPKKQCSGEVNKLNYFEPMLPVVDLSEVEDGGCKNGHAYGIQVWTDSEEADRDRSVRCKGGPVASNTCVPQRRTSAPLSAIGPGLPQIEEIELEDDVGLNGSAKC